MGGTHASMSLAPRSLRNFGGLALPSLIRSVRITILALSSRMGSTYGRGSKLNTDFSWKKRRMFHMEETFHSATNVSLTRFLTFLSYLLWANTMKLSVLGLISRLPNSLSGMSSTMGILRLAIIIRLIFLIRLSMIPILRTPHLSHRPLQSMHRMETLLLPSIL